VHSWGNRVSWLSSRTFALACAVQRLARRPGATLTTLLLAALAIALPLALATLALALTPIWQRLGVPAQAVVFLKLGGSSIDVASVISTALAQPGVSEVSHVPRDAALAGLARLAPGVALPEIKSNPLPDAIVVRFAARTHPAQAQAAIAALRQAARVDAVQFDTDRHRRWHSALTLGLAIASGLGSATLLVAVGVVLVAPRTLAPLDPNEREVLDLAGAAPGFADRPATYAGALLGGASALIGIAIVAGGQAALTPGITELRSAWQSDIAWGLPDLPTLGALVTVAALFGGLGGRLVRR
jgi:cell division transport system permease protein